MGLILVCIVILILIKGLKMWEILDGNKIIYYGLVICITIITLKLKFFDLREFLKNINFNYKSYLDIFNFLYNLSLSYISAFVFYILTIQREKIEYRKRYSNIVIKFLNLILGLKLNSHYQELFFKEIEDTKEQFFEENYFYFQLPIDKAIVEFKKFKCKDFEKDIDFESMGKKYKDPTYKDCIYYQEKVLYLMNEENFKKLFSEANNFEMRVISYEKGRVLEEIASIFYIIEEIKRIENSRTKFFTLTLNYEKLMERVFKLLEDNIKFLNFLKELIPRVDIKINLVGNFLKESNEFKKQIFKELSVELGKMIVEYEAGKRIDIKIKELFFNEKDGKDYFKAIDNKKYYLEKLVSIKKVKKNWELVFQK